MFERLVIDVLHETDVLGAARILRMTWDEVWHVMERAVGRGLKRKRRRRMPYIGVDEKAAAKGHKYLTLVCDLKRATVEYVGDDRKKESLDGYFDSLTEAQLGAIQGIALDMWQPYIASIEEHFALADWKMVFDRFHIMQHVGRAVDAVRKQEHRALRADGDDALLRTKYLWLHSQENLSDERRVQLDGLLRRADLKTARAWTLKEALRRLWHYRSEAWAKKHWRRWYFWATHSRLAPMIKAARTLKSHLTNIMTFFTHRITNAVAEGLNSKIQTIKQKACGYRNRDNFRTAIFFHCGGLSLYPATPATH
jgi:transposase